MIKKWLSLWEKLFSYHFLTIFLPISRRRRLLFSKPRVNIPPKHYSGGHKTRPLQKVYGLKGPQDGMINCASFFCGPL